VLREQVDALHSIASDLVSDDRLEDVLQRITDRAASAVLAPGYLLAVSSPHDGSPLVFSCGIAGDEQAQLAQRLLHREDLGPAALVVDVASTRRHHGRLAALNAEGHVGVGDERRMLTLYAEHAAVALDLLAALEGRRNGEERATALLGLSHRLATTDGTAAVADVVAAALPGIVGSESAAVFHWDGVAGEMRAAAVEGLEPVAGGRPAVTPILPRTTRSWWTCWPVGSPGDPPGDRRADAGCAARAARSVHPAGRAAHRGHRPARHRDGQLEPGGQTPARWSRAWTGWPAWPSRRRPRCRTHGWSRP
jgi:hypothetical protein